MPRSKYERRTQLPLSFEGNIPDNVPNTINRDSTDWLIPASLQLFKTLFDDVTFLDEVARMFDKTIGYANGKCIYRPKRCDSFLTKINNLIADESAVKYYRKILNGTDQQQPTSFINTKIFLKLFFYVQVNASQLKSVAQYGEIWEKSVQNQRYTATITEQLCSILKLRYGYIKLDYIHDYLVKLAALLYASVLSEEERSFEKLTTEVFTVYITDYIKEISGEPHSNKTAKTMKAAMTRINDKYLNQCKDKYPSQQNANGARATISLSTRPSVRKS